MFSGTKAIKMSKIPIHVYDPPTFSSFNNWVVLSTEVVRSVTNRLLRYYWPQASDGDRERFFDIIFALIRSVGSDTLTSLSKKEPEEIKSLCDKNFDEMLKMEKRDFDNPIVPKRVEIKNKYYERMFELRSLIQNFNWNYHGLAEDAYMFMKSREKIKMYHKDYTEAKKNPSTCVVCHQVCVQSPLKFCSFCYNYDRLEHFIKISTSLHCMGSYFLFYWYLSEPTIRYIEDNWKTLEVVFSKQCKSSPVEMYLNEIELNAKFVEARNDMNLCDNKEEDDAMYDLIKRLDEDQNKDNKEKEKEEDDYRKKLDFLKRYREKQRIKKQQAALEKSRIDAARKLENKRFTAKLVQAVYLKELTEDPMFKKAIEDSGEKKLDQNP